MSTSGEALAAAAESLVGAPFRLHGRDPDFGLDCVGLVAAALERAGRPAMPPCGYRLRQRAAGPLLRAAANSGLVPATGPIAPGDVCLVTPGPAQHHLLVASNCGGFVHAHAGLRRVVLSPAPHAWPFVRRWRLIG
jgi:cell wall-associated NlpC family hydrolase